MNWIRVAVGIKDDPKLSELADRLNVQLAHAVGHVVCTLLQFPDHALSGDISRISPATLERWAGWSGPKGKYDAAFRAVFCVEGVVPSWMKHNGAPIRKSLADVEYRRDERARQREKSGKSRRDVGATSALTRRDETETTTTLSTSDVRCSTSSGPQSIGDVMPQVIGTIVARQTRRPA